MFWWCLGWYTENERGCARGRISLLSKFVPEVQPSSLPRQNCRYSVPVWRKQTPGVYVTTRAGNHTSFSLKTGHYMNGVATTKDLNFTGMAPFLSNVWEKRSASLRIWGTVLWHRVHKQCGQNLTTFARALATNVQEVYLGGKCGGSVLKTPQGRRRSRSCTGFVKLSQRADSCCTRSIASRPHATPIPVPTSS